MLFKNDVKFEIPENKLKELKAMKFPVVFKLPDEKWFKNSTNGRKERPGGIIIPYEERVEDKNEGSVKWNYTQLPPIRNNDNIRYYDNGDAAYFMTGSKMYIKETQIDLLYFLLNISTVVKESPMCSNPQIMREDPLMEAKGRNKVRAQETAIRSALFGDHPLDHADIVRLAKAFKVAGADALELDEVKDKLYEAVEARQKDMRYKDGYSMFLELAGNEERVEILASIQKAKDMKRLTYVQKSGKWLTLDDTGKKTGELCNLIGGKTPDESLEYHAINNPEVAEKIKGAIAELQAA